MKLDGKIAIVTGSGQGIGQDIAISLAAAGASVVINYRSDITEAEETLKQVEVTGSKGLIVKADVSVVSDLRQLIDYITGSKFFVDGGLLWNYQE